MQKKYEHLKNIIREYKSVAVAFSGGVDSSLLLYAAHDALPQSTAAFVAVSQLVPDDELAQAERFAQEIGVPLEKVSANPFEASGFSDNPPDRCYICKKHILSQIKTLAKKQGFLFTAEGSNADDSADYRPGAVAVSELSVKSPLKDAGLTKAEIRTLCRKFSLSVADKPSSPCMATRIPYGDKITERKLEIVAKGEEILHSLGFNEVRLRLHGNVARIETNNFDNIMQKEVRAKTAQLLLPLGIDFVAVDIEGFKSGNMNKTIDIN